MQFTSTIIVALLAVSTSNLTTAQKISNLRGGGDGGHGVGVGLDTTVHTSLEHVTPTRKLEEEKGISNPPEPVLESSITLDDDNTDDNADDPSRMQDDWCPGWDSHTYWRDDECPKCQIMCFDVNSFDGKGHPSYCHDCPNNPTSKCYNDLPTECRPN